LTYLGAGCMPMWHCSSPAGKAGKMTSADKAPQLGLIRTQELVAATRSSGVKLYLRARKIWNFRKPEETEKVWWRPGLKTMVRVIPLPPEVVINGGRSARWSWHLKPQAVTPRAYNWPAIQISKLPEQHLTAGF